MVTMYYMTIWLQNQYQCCCNAEPISRWLEQPDSLNQNGLRCASLRWLTDWWHTKFSRKWKWKTFIILIARSTKELLSVGRCVDVPPIQCMGLVQNVLSWCLSVLFWRKEILFTAGQNIDACAQHNVYKLKRNCVRNSSTFLCQTHLSVSRSC